MSVKHKPSSGLVVFAWCFSSVKRVCKRCASRFLKRYNPIISAQLQRKMHLFQCWSIQEWSPEEHRDILASLFNLFNSFLFFAVGKSYGVMSHSLALWMRSISRFWSFLRLQDGVLTMDGCASSLLQVPAWRRSFNLFASSFWICEEMAVFQRGLLVLIRCHERCKIELAVEVCWTQLGHAEGTRRGQENQLLVMILPHAVLWWNTKSIKIKQFGAQKLQDFLESL